MPTSPMTLSGPYNQNRSIVNILYRISSVAVLGMG